MIVSRQSYLSRWRSRAIARRRSRTCADADARFRASVEDKDVFAETIVGRAATKSCIVDVCDASTRLPCDCEGWVDVGWSYIVLGGLHYGGVGRVDLGNLDL